MRPIARVNSHRGGDSGEKKSLAGRRASTLSALIESATPPVWWLTQSIDPAIIGVTLSFANVHAYFGYFERGQGPGGCCRLPHHLLRRISGLPRARRAFFSLAILLMDANRSINLDMFLCSRNR